MNAGFLDLDTATRGPIAGNGTFSETLSPGTYGACLLTSAGYVAACSTSFEIVTGSPICLRASQSMSTGGDQARLDVDEE